jgi:single-strand DNA-binding protein
MKTTNKVELNGFIGNTPEMKTLKNGSKVVNLTLATDETYKNKDGEWVKNTTWHRVTMWNKAAEKAAEILKKGTRVALTGRIVNREYLDKDGNKRTFFEVLANSFEPQMAA